MENIIKLWKEEDYPQDPAPQDPPVDNPPPADPPKVDDPEPPVEPAPTIDTSTVIKDLFGRTEEEIKNDLAEAQRLRGLSVDDPELLPDDDFLKNFIKAYKRGGKTVAENYLEAISVDYKKLSPEQVVEHSVRRKIGKDAPEIVFKKEYERELRSMGWSEELEPGTPEYKEYEDHIRWRAGNMVNELTQEQAKFKIPERHQAQPEPELDKDVFDGYVRATKSHPSSLRVLEQKSVKIGDHPIAVDPESMINQAIDTGLFLKNFVTSTGEPDYERFYKIAAIATKGPDEFIKEAVADALAKEKLKWIAEMKNPSNMDPKPPASDAGFKVKLM